jgi:tetratricopeptide (TPR) repeat protein
MNRLLLSCALALSTATSLAAQGHEHDHAGDGSAVDIRGLGRVEFANSGSAAAQPAFVRGMTLLHSFLFREAREALREAERIDPHFAMAYWGEAMAAGDSAATDSILRRMGPTPAARLALAPTARERAYLELMERFGLLGEGASDTIAPAWAEAWRGLHEAYPADDDATLFYALALIDERNSDMRDPSRTLRLGVQGAALAEEVFRRRPDHPGAAHYLIHAYDDSRLAPLGLRAARIYADIAPVAHHAVHMPSHIFFQFGMWPEVAAANERAWVLSRSSTTGRALPPEEWDYHAGDWLQYAFLQQGRIQRAAALADSIRAAWTPERLAAVPEFTRGYMQRRIRAMRARTRLATRDWSQVDFPTGLAPDVEWLLAARGAAARRDTASIARMVARVAAVADSMRREEPSRNAATPIILRQLRALASLAAGDSSAALAALRTAADSAEARPALYLAEGPERAEAGSTRVMLGELLLDRGQPAEALAAFDRGLELSPGNAAALLGRARALAGLGRQTEARETYRMLLKNWANADPGLPGLAEVQAGAR